MTVLEAKRKTWDAMRMGSHETEAGFDEAEPCLNDCQRMTIQAMHDAHGGECWLGIVNLYRDRPHPVLWRYEPDQIVCNFEASFVIPRYDAELERLIRERAAAEYTGTTADYARINVIHDRVKELGGEHLLWN